MEEMISQIQEMVALYGVKVLAAIAILVLGRWAAKLLRRLLKKAMERSGTDATIQGFVANIVYVAMLVFVVIAALGQLGIQTTSFIAILGAAGLAIGLALQGSLSNFAAGFLMIIFRPFNVGDFIEGAGVAGTVEQIQIFNTILRTGDNKVIIVPNAKLGEDNIVNYSTKETRRVDLVVGVGYEDDLAKVKSVLSDIIAKEDRVLADPEPLVAVSELADSSVNLVVRVWVKSSDYWAVTFAMNETIKLRFDQEGISIPYPQQDVHMFEHKNAA
jgi:small conductance mechanosensitive channel